MRWWQQNESNYVTSFPEQRGPSPIDSTPLLCSPRFSSPTKLQLPDFCKCNLTLPQTFILKMANAMFAKTLGRLQQQTRLFLGSQSCTSNSSRKKKENCAYDKWTPRPIRYEKSPRIYLKKKYLFKIRRYICSLLLIQKNVKIKIHPCYLTVTLVCECNDGSVCICSVPFGNYLRFQVRDEYWWHDLQSRILYCVQSVQYSRHRQLKVSLSLQAVNHAPSLKWDGWAMIYHERFTSILPLPAVPLKKTFPVQMSAVLTNVDIIQNPCPKCDSRPIPSSSFIP